MSVSLFLCVCVCVCVCHFNDADIVVPKILKLKEKKSVKKY